MNFRRAAMSLMVSMSLMLGASLLFTRDPHVSPLPEVKRKAPAPVAEARKPEAARPVPKEPEAPVETAEAPKLHFTEDPDWSRPYEKTGDRDRVFKADATKPAFKKRWLGFAGPEYIDSGDLEKIVRIAMKRMPHIPQKDEIAKLIVETSVAESLSGRYTSSKGGDHGIFQIREKAATDLLGWLKHRRKDVHDAVMLFHDPKKSMAENLDSNIPFGAAVAICEYWRKAGPDFHEQIGSLRDRAIMWKSVYNTHRGKGTVLDYEKRVTDWAAISKDGVAKLNERLLAQRKGDAPQKKASAPKRKDGGSMLAQK